MKFTKAEKVLSKLVVEDTIRDLAEKRELVEVIEILTDQMKFMNTEAGINVIQNIMSGYAVSIKAEQASGTEAALSLKLTDEIGANPINLNAHNLLQAVISELDNFLKLDKAEQIKIIDSLT